MTLNTLHSPSAHDDGLFFPQLCFDSFSTNSSVSIPARHLPPTVHRTTFQSITITSTKEDIKEEQMDWTDLTPAPSLPSPSTPPSSDPASSPLSPQAQPSLLASLLARKRSIVTVPATKDVSPPLRGSSRPSPDRLPYLPHSPFHLFSYDLNEEPSPPNSAKHEESPITMSPRSGRRQNSNRDLQKDFLVFLTLHFSVFTFHFCFSDIYLGTHLDLLTSLFIHRLPFSPVLFPLFDCLQHHALSLSTICCSFSPFLLCSVIAWICHTCLQSSLYFLMPWPFLSITLQVP